ncbi:MAG: hypothetical protein ACLGHX_01295 [Acidimicrobiia bacterium]
MMGLFHAAQAVTVLGLSNDFAVPVAKSALAWQVFGGTLAV